MPTIRVSTSMRDLLQQLAKESGISRQLLLEKAIEAYRRQQLLESTNAAYAALQSNADAWDELEKERLAWEQTLADGLEDSYGITTMGHRLGHHAAAGRGSSAHPDGAVKASDCVIR